MKTSDYKPPPLLPPPPLNPAKFRFHYASHYRNSPFSIFSYLFDSRRPIRQLFRRWVVYTLTIRCMVFSDMYIFAFSFYLLINPPKEAQHRGVTQFPGETGMGTVVITFLWKLVSSVLYWQHMEEVLRHQLSLRQSEWLSVEILESFDLSSDWMFLIAMITYWNLLFDIYLLICLTPSGARDSHSEETSGAELPKDLVFFQTLLILSFLILSLFPILQEIWLRMRKYCIFWLNAA